MFFLKVYLSSLTNSSANWVAKWQFDFSNEFKFKLSNRPHYREDELETDTWWPRTEGENYNDIMVHAVLDKLQEKPVKIKREPTSESEGILYQWHH